MLIQRGLLHDSEREVAKPMETHPGTVLRALPSLLRGPQQRDGQNPQKESAPSWTSKREDVIVMP